MNTPQPARVLKFPERLTVALPDEASTGSVVAIAPVADGFIVEAEGGRFLFIPDAPEPLIPLSA